MVPLTKAGSVSAMGSPRCVCVCWCCACMDTCMYIFSVIMHNLAPTRHKVTPFEALLAFRKEARTELRLLKSQK